MLAQVVKAAESARQMEAPLPMLLPLAIVSLVAYGRWVRLLRTRGGRVSTERIGWPDLAATLLLGNLLFLLGFRLFASKQPVLIDVGGLVTSSLIELAVVFLLGAFLYFRSIDTVVFFGLRRLSFWRILGHALLFLVAALPAMALLGALMAGRGTAPEEQEIVVYFRHQAQAGDYRALLTVAITAVVVAPIFEECFFRGFFYPTLKRFGGPVLAAVLVSALFAWVHGNVISLPIFFVLALCLTLAYEWTGSLLVSVAMHALFNAVNLAVMYRQMTHSSS